MYVGKNREPQTLIVDTGSNFAAFPCENHCTKCGTHLNPYYKIDNSSTKELY